MPGIFLQISPPPSNLPFLFAAFAVTWIVFFGYAFFISRHREELQREIRSLQQELDTNDSPTQGDQSAI